MRRLGELGDPVYRREEETQMASKQGKYTYYTSLPRRIIEYSKMALQALDQWGDETVTVEGLKAFYRSLDEKVTIKDIEKWLDDPIIPYRKQVVTKHHYVFRDGTIVIVIEPSGRLPHGKISGPGRRRIA